MSSDLHGFWYRRIEVRGHPSQIELDKKEDLEKRFSRYLPDRPSRFGRSVINPDSVAKLILSEREE